MKHLFLVSAFTLLQWCKRNRQKCSEAFLGSFFTLSLIFTHPKNHIEMNKKNIIKTRP
jgi:Na+-translocating ferredoxin:NAD+ oxidoreductase RnfD subunit